MNPNTFRDAEQIVLSRPIGLRALNNTSVINEKIRIKCFREFKSPNDNLEFFVYKFHNIYDGLIGNDILMKYNTLINYTGKIITINNVEIKLKFSNDPENTVYQIDPGEYFYRIPVAECSGYVVISEAKLNDHTTVLEGVYDVNSFKALAKILNTGDKPQILNLDNNFKTIDISEIQDFNNFETLILNNDISGNDSIPMDLVRTDHLNNEEKRALKEVINKYKAIFNDIEPLTFTSGIKHRVNLTDNLPVRGKIYRYPYIHKVEIQKQIGDLLDNGIIRHSSSPYNSPVWVVQKKADSSGLPKWRLVIDYRKLNEKTIDDRYPIPNIEEILDKLGRCNYFSTIDLKSGFHQIEMEETDVEKTAFSVDHGHYEYLRMPFGLKNAPSTFQRLMDNVLRECIGKQCLVYMDDIIVFSNGLNEHINSLKIVFEKLSRARLRVQVDKCEFLRKEVEFLGHLVTEEGIHPNPKKIEVIRDFRIPDTQKGIKRFLGIAGYYRKFIRDFANIAKPMTVFLKKGSKINISDEKYIDSFEKLKNKLITSPILTYPDFSKTFEVTTDASQYALGGVLSQENKPISYISRTLNEHEINYSTIEKELLSIVWCLKQFRPYVYGREIKLFTDHRPLVWLSNLKEPNSKLIRWKLQLEEYNYQIFYKQGKENKVADFLSRIEINLNEADDGETHIRETITPINLYTNQVIIHGIGSGSLQIRNETIFGKSRKTIKIRNVDEGVLIMLIKNHFSPTNMNALFTNDEIFNKINELYDEHFRNYRIIRCKRILKDLTDETEIERIIGKYHLENNHRGINELYEELKREFYTPNMRTKITEFVNNCETCILEKYERKPIKPPFKISETPNKPNQIIHLDVFYSINRSIFATMIDKFSKVALFVRMNARSEPEFRKAILRYISVYGKVDKIITDNELGMKSNLMRTFLTEKNIEIHFASNSNHNSNADIERLHNTVNEHLRILKHRKRHLPIEEQMLLINGYYNNTIHSTTRVKPIDFIQGRIKDDEYDGIHKLILDKKEGSINKLNLNRSDVTIESGINYIKEVRGGKNHSRFRKIDTDLVDNEHVRDKRYGHMYYKTNVRAKRKFQSDDKTRFRATRSHNNIVDVVSGNNEGSAVDGVSNGNNTSGQVAANADRRFNP